MKIMCCNRIARTIYYICECIHTPVKLKDTYSRIIDFKEFLSIIVSLRFRGLFIFSIIAVTFMKLCVHIENNFLKHLNRCHLFFI